MLQGIIIAVLIILILACIVTLFKIQPEDAGERKRKEMIQSEPQTIPGTVLNIPMPRPAFSERTDTVMMPAIKNNGRHYA